MGLPFTNLVCVCVCFPGCPSLQAFRLSHSAAYESSPQAHRQSPDAGQVHCVRAIWTPRCSISTTDLWAAWVRRGTSGWG